MKTLSKRVGRVERVRRRRGAPVLAALSLLAALVADSSSRAGNDDALDRANTASEYVTGLDFDEARKELAAADPESPYVTVAQARLALFEGDCDRAGLLLARPDVAKTEAAESLGEIARGCARVTAATVIDKAGPENVEVRYQDELDRALTPLIVETVVKARDALTRDLGVTWPRPTRITVVRDLLSLSAMTGLPYQSAQTTGTVAVAKWGRVTLLSPRASHHGYSWRDTIAHELTHLAISRATVDRAPLWLHEGLAKREETRWREPGPFDDRPSPDTIAARGIELKMDLPLDKLGPSIAMLPSADAAFVAFAEVTSFVRYFATTSSPDALPRLLLELRRRKTGRSTVDEALTEVGGTDLKGWDVKWRAYIASRPRETLPGILGIGGAPPAPLRDMHERVRLAELLVGRSHPSEAVQELDLIKATDAMVDPSLRYLRARSLELAGRGKEAEPLVADPKEVLVSYGPWWAIRGRWARDRGDSQGVGEPSFVEAVAADPFDIECACQSLDENATPPDPMGKALCDAARHRNEPPLGQD